MTQAVFFMGLSQIVNLDVRGFSEFLTFFTGFLGDGDESFFGRQVKSFLE
jgi:hypothetical protein